MQWCHVAMNRQILRAASLIAIGACLDPLPSVAGGWLGER
jgi:hypothetical protein